jgi:hypothetical protein
MVQQLLEGHVPVKLRIASEIPASVSVSASASVAPLASAPAPVPAAASDAVGISFSPDYQACDDWVLLGPVEGTPLVGTRRGAGYG